MILPTIHDNGTSKDAIIGGLLAASSALGNAYSVLKNTSPNGRDWYPQGPAAMEQATAEHMDRLRRLDTIKEEIDALVVAIDRIGN